MTKNDKQIVRALIIDDELNASNALNSLLTEFCQDVEVVDIQHNVPDGVKAIQLHKPDVVFLDIEMPGASGFSLLDYFDNIDFQIVFATAYNQYALKAFECAALDYLLKPVQIKPLRNTLDRVRKQKMQPESQQKMEIVKENIQQKKITKIGLPANDGLLFVKIEDIIRCEGESNYTTFYLKDKTKIVVSKTLKEYENLLPESEFFRPHKSHLVNLFYIKKWIRTKTSQLVMEDNSLVDVAVRKKDELMTRLSAFHGWTSE
ncbi:MAG: LytR/AlgR family response regulator transcription factor [Bacteroidia bacterium]